MNAAPTRHAEQARRVTGFVHQTMRERGLACQRNELEVALLELTPMQLGQVHSSAAALSKGADGRDDMALLAALRAVSAQPARAALSAAGVMYRADVLLPLASAAGTAPSFSRELSRLRRAELPEASATKRPRSFACCAAASTMPTCCTSRARPLVDRMPQRRLTAAPCPPRSRRPRRPRSRPPRRLDSRAGRSRFMAGRRR